MVLHRFLHFRGPSLAFLRPRKQLPSHGITPRDLAHGGWIRLALSNGGEAGAEERATRSRAAGAVPRAPPSPDRRPRVRRVLLTARTSGPNERAAPELAVTRLFRTRGALRLWRRTGPIL